MAEEDLERLASRIALLVSDEGEADNAGRAAGQLARRLGLSGGQLKVIFLAGVGAVRGDAPAPDPEVENLRRLLDRSDAELRSAEHLVVDLREENEALRDALDRARTAQRVWRVAGVVVLAGALIAAGFARFGAPWRLPEAALPPVGSVLQRLALAGPGGATLYRQPDRDSQVVTRLPGGATLPVRQLLWRGFSQWVETQADGAPAYVVTTEVDLR